MATFSWRLPSPPAAVVAPGTAAAQLQAQARTQLGAFLDMVIDPVTLDYVDTDDGEWLETADSRTLVMIQIEMRLGEDFFAPEDGTRIKALLETGDPVTDQLAVLETRRALQVLVDAGIISEVQVTSKFEGELLTIICNWRDLASGSPVDLVYQPFGQAA